MRERRRCKGRERTEEYGTSAKGLLRPPLMTTSLKVMTALSNNDALGVSSEDTRIEKVTLVDAAAKDSLL